MVYLLIIYGEYCTKGNIEVITDHSFDRQCWGIFEAQIPHS